MIPASAKWPFYARTSLILIGVYVLFTILYLGRQILIPIAAATIIAILLNPIVNFLESRKVKRLVAIGIALIIAILFTAGLVYLITSQLSMFETSIPKMQEKFNGLISQIANWISVRFNINPERVNDWIAKTKANLMSGGNQMIGQTLLTMTSLLIVLFLIPVYICMILYYKPLLLGFLRRLFNKVHQEQLEEVLLRTKGIIQSYLSGLLIEAVIIATLNSIALLIIGVNYAILLGIIGAVLNAIPFIGGIIAVIMPIVVALITKDSPSSAVLVLFSYMTIQFFDNHYITPKIVASKVKINALVAVVVVLLGGAVWGIPGMFIAIPLTGILKVIFEHMEGLKPWAFLLGDDMPAPSKFIFKLPKRKSKKMVG